MARQEVENADDLRLSHRLFKKCMGDKKKFCADIKFGAFPHTSVIGIPGQTRCLAFVSFARLDKCIP